MLSIKASFLAEKYGYEVTILTLNDAYLNCFYEFSPKIKMRSIDVAGNPLKYTQLYRRGIQQTVDEVRPDLISVCDDGLKGFFVPQFLKTKAKIIYERHVSKLIEAKDNHGILKKMLTAGKWKLMEKLAGRFSKFIVLTDGNQKEWQTLDNLEVIPNPLSFYPAGSSALNQKTVICVGKISYQKGQDLLIKAWEYLYEKYPDWKLELYGKEDPDFLDTTDLSNKNIFHFPPEKHIEEKYLNSALYVMSSRFEGFGMVLIEAMACGVPCVSFDCDYGPSDIITDHQDGLLVSKENTDELALKLMMLIENDELRHRLGVNAKKNVLRFEVQMVASRWDQLFKELVN